MKKDVDSNRAFFFPELDRLTDWVWPLVLLLGLVLLLELLDEKFSYVLVADSAHYILLARSIAEGYGYSDIHIPGNPPHTLYPPILPLLLSPFFYLFGYNFLWMKLLITGFAIASVYVIKHLFKEYGNRSIGTMLALLVITNYLWLSLTREILSEMPYMFFSLSTIYLLRRYENTGRLDLSRMMLLVVLLVLTYFTKAIGINLYMAVVVYLFVRADGYGLSRREVVFLAIAGIVPFILWNIRGLFAGGEMSYLSIFFQSDFYDEEKGGLGLLAFLERLSRNIFMYLRCIGVIFMVSHFKSIFVSPLSTVMVSLSIVLAVTVIAGLCYEIYHSRDLKAMYTMFYLLMLIAWQVYGSGDAIRYLMPVLPFIYYYSTVGIYIMARLVPSTATAGFNRVSMLLCCLFLVMNLAHIRIMLNPGTMGRQLHATANILSTSLLRNIETLTPELLTGRRLSGSLSCFDEYIRSAWILKEVSSPGEVIMTRKPELIAMITDRYAVRFPYTKRIDRIARFVEDMGVDYILIDRCYEETERYLFPFIRAHEDMFSVLKPYYTVLKIK